MRALAAFIRVVDALNGWTGRLVSWLVLPVVLIAFTVVVLRYVFSIGFPWLQELYIWLHGAAFMLAGAWVLREGGHVRVDVLYKRWPARRRAWADFLGVWLFLVPMIGVMLYLSLPIVERSWRMAERSPTADGLSHLYVLKAIIPVFCVLVILQGLALAARALFVLLGRERECPPPAGPGTRA